MRSRPRSLPASPSGPTRFELTREAYMPTPGHGTSMARSTLMRLANTFCYGTNSLTSTSLDVDRGWFLLGKLATFHDSTVCSAWKFIWKNRAPPCVKSFHSLANKDRGSLLDGGPTTASRPSVPPLMPPMRPGHENHEAPPRRASLLPPSLA